MSHSFVIAVLRMSVSLLLRVIMQRDSLKQDRQRTHNVTLKRVCVTIVAMEKQ